MPRKNSRDDETPRRRRNVVAAAAEPEHGLLLRILLHSPKDSLAGLVAFAACGAIITNALFLQNGPHPAPMFGPATTTTGLVPSPLPRARPAQADAFPAAEPKLSESRLFDPTPVEPRPVDSKRVEPKPVEPKPVDSKPLESRPIEPRSFEARSADQRSSDGLANLVKATGSGSVPQTNAVRPPAPIPQPAVLTGARRVAAIQRVLTEYGYGQLKPTGTIGPETKIAIEKFERERRLPLSGQVTERLVRELAAVTGRPIE